MGVNFKSNWAMGSSVFRFAKILVAGILFPILYISGYAAETPSFQDLLMKARSGNPPAMVALGLRYDYGQKGAPEDLKQAIYWYRKAAGRGDPAAMLLLSQRYEIGRGVLSDDLQALHWLRMAARHGYPPAEDALGDRYVGGQGVTKNDRMAVHWYLRAASHGYGESQDILAERYETGKGVPKNLKKAAYWYLRAARDSGSPDAFSRLGFFSEKGLGGMKPNLSQAYFWYSLAKDTSLSARKGMTRLEAHLSEQEKTRAWKKMTEFLARYKSSWGRWILRP